MSEHMDDDSVWPGRIPWTLGNGRETASSIIDSTLGSVMFLVGLNGGLGIPVRWSGSARFTCGCADFMSEDQFELTLFSISRATKAEAMAAVEHEWREWLKLPFWACPKMPYHNARYEVRIVDGSGVVHAYEYDGDLPENGSPSPTKSRLELLHEALGGGWAVELEDRATMRKVVRVGEAKPRWSEANIDTAAETNRKRLGWARLCGRKL